MKWASHHLIVACAPPCLPELVGCRPSVRQLLGRVLRCVLLSINCHHGCQLEGPSSPQAYLELIRIVFSSEA